MAALVAAISFLEAQCLPSRDARDEPGHDSGECVPNGYAPLFSGENRMRLANKTAIVIGAGQGPGTGMGNGRATVIRFAQEGASVLAVDRDLPSAQETCAMAAKEGKGSSDAFA